MQDVLAKVQIHIPFKMLWDGYLPILVRERIHPEIGFNHEALDLFRPADFRKIAAAIVDAGLTTTIHAPFMDLRPGALDPKIRRASLDRIQQVFDLASDFRPRSIVFHPSFDERYYVSTEAQWLQNSIATWKAFLPLAEELDTVIALENVYETDPSLLEALLQACSSPHIRFCFDTGHFNCFARTPLEEWLAELGPFVGQLHLHDNHGTKDEHLPVGDGTFPFHKLFQELGKIGKQPIMTLEAHSEKHLWQTLENIRRMNLLSGF